jgi:hypothetical protein
MDNNIKFDHKNWKIHSCECKNIKCKQDKKCVHFKVVDKKLTNSMYGWTIFEVIDLNNIEKLDKNLKINDCDKILKLIHPAKNTIWIGRVKKTDQNLSTSYIIFCGGKIKTSDSIEEMNKKIKDDFGYDEGRNIIDGDFT